VSTRARWSSRWSCATVTRPFPPEAARFDIHRTPNRTSPSAAACISHWRSAGPGRGQIVFPDHSGPASQNTLLDTVPDWDCKKPIHVC